MQSPNGPSSGFSNISPLMRANARSWKSFLHPTVPKNYMSTQPGCAARSAKFSASFAPCVCRVTISSTSSRPSAHESSRLRARRLRTRTKYTCASRSSTIRPNSRRGGEAWAPPSLHHFHLACVKLQIGITKGLLALPQDLSTPVICIGPGTGVAPARAVLEARVHLGGRDNTLYFGHRASEKDAHYSREWTTLAESGNLTYRVAASRDGPQGTRRVYVQDLIRQDAKRIWRLVHDRGAWVYISGSSNKMPAGVRAAFVDIAREEGEMDEEEARAYIAQLEKDERLFEECWS